MTNAQYNLLAEIANFLVRQSERTTVQSTEGIRKAMFDVMREHTAELRAGVKKTYLDPLALPLKVRAKRKSPLIDTGLEYKKRDGE